MTFKQAVVKTRNKTTTTNGAVAYKSTLNSHVDLFSRVGALRNDPKQAIILFEKALQDDAEKALRVLLWARDVRGGAGERNVPRQLLTYVAKNHPDLIRKSGILKQLTEVGRWDDLLVLVEGSRLQKRNNVTVVVPAIDSCIQSQVVDLIRDALAAGNGLCAKWMPRKGDLSCILRHELQWSPKFYRKTLVNLTNVVETQMCNREFTGINFEHVPSQAMSKYMTAFWRNAPAEMQKFKERLEKGEAKINAATLFPHQCYMDIRNGKSEAIVNAQWKALPDYIGSDRKILPMIDVSGSMTCSAGAGSGVTCMDVAIGLGLYCADRTQGAFHNMFLTFSSNPKIQVVSGSKLSVKMQQIQTADWGMSTNIDKAFAEILSVAQKGKVAQEDMPEMLLIMSDMQFDRCGTMSNYASMKQLYKAAGYKIPKVVFWNLNAVAGNSPVKAGKDGTALVSGFSPAILKAVLADNFDKFTPENVMLEAIMKDRYDPLLKVA